jgi:hypothetical protein
MDRQWGVDMTTITAPEIQGPMERLLTELSQHGTRHLSEAETDLGQTGILLEEAITKLSAAFMELHAAVRAQQQQVDSLLEGIAADPHEKEKLHQLSEAIGVHVNEAITGLQFQDLTGQLIARTSRRLCGLRDMLSEVGEAADILHGSESGRLNAPALHAVSDSLVARSTALEDVLRKSVLQHHMESGDIDLF